MKHIRMGENETHTITSFDFYYGVENMKQVREAIRSLFDEMEQDDIRYINFHTGTGDNADTGNMVRVQMDGMSEYPLAIIRVEITQNGNLEWRKMWSRREAYAYIRSILQING